VQINQSIKASFLLDMNSPSSLETSEEAKKTFKKEEYLLENQETKVQKCLTVKRTEKELLLEEFQNSLKYLQEEDTIKILTGKPDFNAKYESALKIKRDLEASLKINAFELSFIDKGRYLKKDCGNHKKRTLVIEIQGVIQYISGLFFKDCDLCIPTFKNGNFLLDLYIKNRKYIGEFLLTMSKNFELIIFSEMQDDILISLTDFLEEAFTFKFDYVIGRSHSFYTNSSITLKNLNCLLVNRRKEDIIIVDYNINNSCFYLDNTIIVPQYKGKDEDTDFLKHLAKYLLKKAD